MNFETLIPGRKKEMEKLIKALEARVAELERVVGKLKADLLHR